MVLASSQRDRKHSAQATVGLLRIFATGGPRYAWPHGLVLPKAVLAGGFYLVALHYGAVFIQGGKHHTRPALHGHVSGPGNISSFIDDLLDWDTGIDVAPPRPSGKISVTLHFAGRGAPRPLGDY